MNLSAQIPINGFCKINSIETNRYFTKIKSLNYNLDEYSDFLLYGVDGKTIIVHEGEEKKLLSKPIEKFSYFTIDNLVPLNRRNKENRFYIFLSRKERLAGLVSFSKYGTMRILNQIKFDSYPSNIDIGDVDGDGKNEALISGANFHGLSILKEENYILKETKIVEKRIFLDAKFIDLDYDSYADIAAIDLISNSIEFFYNIEFSEFREYRSIKIGEEVSELQIMDFNGDDFRDILYSGQQGIQILFGDSVSTFEQREIIKTSTFTDKFIVRDFNSDGLNDIAYMNRSDGNLFVKFAKSDSEFYSPIHYMHDDALQDMIAFRSSGRDYLAALNDNGMIKIIGKMDSLTDEIDIAIAASPASLYSSNSFVNGTRDICFVDELNNNLIVLINDKNKLFSKYYSYTLSDNYENILIDDTRKNQRTFYLYTHGGKFIEIVNIDFETDKYKRDYLYTYSPIMDIKFKEGNHGGRKSFYVLTNNNGIVGLVEYEYHDFKYFANVYHDLISNITDASLIQGDTLSIFYWRINEGIMENGRLTLEGEHRESSVIAAFNCSEISINSVFVKSFDFIYKDKELPVSIINDFQKPIVNFYNGFKIINAVLEGNLNSIDSKNHLQVFHNPVDRTSFLYLYDYINGTLFRSEVPDTATELKFAKVFESMNCNSYFVHNLFFGKTYLAYAELTTNYIKLKRIE